MRKLFISKRENKETTQELANCKQPENNDCQKGTNTNDEKEAIIEITIDSEQLAFLQRLLSLTECFLSLLK